MIELDTKGFKFDVICLQETWLNGDDDICTFITSRLHLRSFSDNERRCSLDVMKVFI